MSGASSESARLIDTFSGGQRDVLERIAGGAPLAEVLERIVRLVEQQSSGMYCSILLLDREKGRIRHGAAPSLPEEYNRGVDGILIGPEAGSCGTAAYLRERVIVEDIATHRYWDKAKDFALMHGLRACWSTPIFTPSREVMGTFAMYYRVPRGPMPEEIGWVDAATHLAAIALCRDAADQALQRSEQEFRAVFERSAMGMCLVTGDGRLRRSNPALQHLLGYSAAELCEMTVKQLTHPEDYDPGLFNELVAGERGSYRYDKRYIRKDGGLVWVRITTSAVHEPDGSLRFVVGMIEDVTQRREAEEQRARLEGQLRQSQKMQSLGTLAGGIAHDFNNILTAIVGNTSLAISEVSPQDPVSISLKEIEAASERAVDLVQQILTFSRPQAMARRVVRLQTVLDEALRLLRASLPTTINIRPAFDSQTPEVAADSTQIHQVVMNLGANAAHAMGDRGGLLEWRLAPFYVDAEFASALPGLHEGWHARMTVADSGCGMDASTLERIFEPFFSTKGQGKGTGLGLSVVHGIVRGHHGAITVQSKRGEGTTFDLYFPAAEAGSRQAAPLPGNAPRGNGERVLYLDDEERLVFLAGRALEQLGYSFTGFSNPVQALAAFHVQPMAFDVVVTDLTMPMMTGLDFATELGRLRPGLPILLTSGYLRPQDEEAARRLGIREFIAKPATLDDLGRAIHAALSRGDTAAQP